MADFPNFLEELRWRGLIQDFSAESELIALPKDTSFYVGFDPTAAGLHLGNLVQLKVALHLARAGLRPIILFGGATGAIGDPSGKSRERPLLSAELLQSNIDAQQRKASEIFNRGGGGEVLFVNNRDWTAGLSVIDFLRDVGKHFTVNFMLAKEVVKARLEGEGLSFTEFSYMLLQAHDFLVLNQRYGCRLQFGGSDQWGNITAGLEFIRKKIAAEVSAFSTPLLTDSQGKKYGKTEGGAVWIAEELLSPYKLHQYFLNCGDADVVRMLKIFTFFGPEEIARYEGLVANEPEKRAAQRALADEVCTLVHGSEATADANRGAQVLFGGGSLSGLSETLLRQIFEDVPSTSLTRSEFSAMTVADLLVRTGACKSKGDAKRLVANGGAYLFDQRLEDPTALLESNGAVSDKKLLILRSGKKSYFLVQIEA